MIDLYWYEAFPPRDATLADVTAMVRVLAGRPHYGLLGLQPVVVFELWVHSDRVRWLLGIEARIARTLPGELRGSSPAWCWQRRITRSGQPQSRHGRSESRAWCIPSGWTLPGRSLPA